MSSFLKIEQLFAHAATGLSITDHDGRILHANGALAKILQSEPDTLRNLELFAKIHPDDLLHHEALLKKLLAGEVPGFVVEKRYLRPDGTAVWVRNSVSLMDQEQADQTGYLVHICEDISERKHAEQALERQEQMASIGRLTSSIVHEINNPLEAVFNLIYLARYARDLEEASPFLKTAEEELRRACEITMQGLQFHRQPALAASANVVEILKTVLVLFRGKLREAGVRVDLVTEGSTELMCFAGEVRQVFVNLIGNAVDAMAGGGLLTLRVRPGTDWHTGSAGIRVTVADSGHGMTAETRSRIYEAFYTTKGSHGSGLGLWLTSNIVRKHEGSMHVRSRSGAASGTIFTLVFPSRGATGKSSGFQDAA